MRGRNTRAWIGTAIAANLLVLATTAGGTQAARAALIEIEIDFDTDPPSVRGGGHVVGVNQPGPEIELIDYYSGHLAL